MAKTKIEWADRVWNPVVGCTPVSAGCAHCYAKRIYDRFYQDQPFSKVQLHAERLVNPFHWLKPSRVFVNSVSDLFHPDVPDGYIDQVFTVMAFCWRQTFLILTKRPERMYEYLTTRYTNGGFSTSEIIKHNVTGKSGPYPPAGSGFVWPLPNVWLGVTAENQEAADKRIPHLLLTPAAVRFASVEPMLGPVDISGYLDSLYILGERPELTVYKPPINWVICGGETGPGARPMHPDWVRSLLDQCQNAEVPFFFKSWGEWTTEYPQGRSLANMMQKFQEERHFYRVGKSAAGRLLDGREWNEFPEVK